MGSRYLEGVFAPVREELTVTDLPVTGTIPEHLDGRYVRNGPNPVTDPDPASYHWFMGTGMVHGVRLRDGRAEWYRNRWVRARDVTDALGEEPRSHGVAVDVDYSPNTHVIGHEGRTYALIEGGFRPYELTDELDTVGPTDFDGTLAAGYSSHPKLDPATGELHAVAYSYTWGNKVQYSVIGTEGRVRHTADLEVTSSRMVHDFFLTENHVVICDLPVSFAQGLTDEHPYRWDPDGVARLGVMAREGDGSDIAWFEVEPCAIFHTLNAYEDGERVVLDFVRREDVFHDYLFGPDEGTSTLDRWTLDLGRGVVVQDRLDDRPQEMPSTDERFLTRRHRYGYTVGTTELGVNALPARVVFKHDLSAQSTEMRSFGDGTALEQLVFVPRGPDAAEGEGSLVGFVHRADHDRSDLIVLDAESLDTVATVHLPARVPYGFCGSWIPAD